MPFYYPLKRLSPKQRTRAVGGLKRLRTQLNAELPQKTRSKTLILGTWNIRNYDDNRFKNGERTIEDITYLAEIISHFDVIAVQEVCRDLGPLKQLMDILGDRDYDFIMSDTTEGRSGNEERLGFIFDKNKVHFKGVAGELVLPEKQELVQDEKKRQFSRTPFMCSFQSGWFKFMFSTVHIYFGANSGPKYERRVKEIDGVAKFLAKRAEKEVQNHILVGDFNILNNESKGSNALKNNGFKVVQNKEGSNKDQTKFYDQISFRVREDELCQMTGAKSKGVFQFFDSIYRPDDFKDYQTDMKKVIRDKIPEIIKEIKSIEKSLAKARTEKSKADKEKDLASKKNSLSQWRLCLKNTAAGKAALRKYYLKVWRTFHASDHLPLWVELKIDFSDKYLDGLL